MPASQRLFRTTMLLLMSLAATGIPGLAQADEHDRPVLTQAQEAAWLEALIAASPHRRALQAGREQFGELPPGDVDGSAVDTWQPGSLGLAPPAKAQTKKKGPRNYGFLPYWTLGAKLHWDELTEVAWFSAEVDSAGKIGNTHGWGGATAKALIKEAHSHGVQVTLTFTLFSSSGISAAIGTAAKRKALIDKIVALVISGGGDGCNIDFEGLPSASREAMKAFAIDLTKAMHSKLPGSDVTLATPCVDWSGAWDYDYLAEGTDGLFVMAYAIHYGGGNPGPQLPMASIKPWTHKTLQWVVDDYVKWGKAANSHKFLMGLPLYGNDWPSASSQPAAAKLGKGKSVTYENAQVTAPKKGGWKWDAGSKSSYYAYKSGGEWHQAWVDTPAAFDMRVDYLQQRGVNMGLWALGYADKNPEVWKKIGGFVGSGGASSSGGTDAGGSSSGGTPDAGGSSGGTPDAGGSSSGGTPDAGGSSSGATPDAGGSSSGGTPDAGGSSSGPMPDTSGSSSSGGTPDAGGSSSGTPDAGGSSDTGAPQADAGPAADAAQPKPDTGGQTDTAQQNDSAPSRSADVAAAADAGRARSDTELDTAHSVAGDASSRQPSAGAGPAPGASGGCQALPPAGGPLPTLIMMGLMLIGLAGTRRH